MRAGSGGPRDSGAGSTRRAGPSFSMAVTLQNGSFFGRAGTPLRIDDVVLTETSYGSGFVVPLHAHAHPFFCLPLEGTFVEHFERTRRVLQPRAAFYHPAAYDHAETFEGGPARLFNIQLGGAWLQRVAAFGVDLPDQHIPLPDGRLPALALHLHDEYRLGGERLVVDGLLLAMIGELLKWRRTRERHGAPGWMNAVVAAIRTAAPGDVALSDLAAIAQVHPAHLARTFRSVHGCTIGEYARRLRVALARDLLTASDLPLSRVALRCGFADQSHFTRVFRRVVGVTPSVYRKATRR